MTTSVDSNKSRAAILLLASALAFLLVWQGWGLTDYLIYTWRTTGIFKVWGGVVVIVDAIIVIALLFCVYERLRKIISNKSSR